MSTSCLIGGSGNGVLNPALESFVKDGKLVVRVDLPGIEPKDVEVMVTGKTLTIRGKREQRSDDKGSDWFRREVHYGSFERSFELPEAVKPEEITARIATACLSLPLRCLSQRPVARSRSRPATRALLPRTPEAGGMAFFLSASRPIAHLGPDRKWRSNPPLRHFLACQETFSVWHPTRLRRLLKQPILIEWPYKKSRD
jgi:HSP20 family molecular chaperone IbpA